jgi:hypothetical protein
MVEITHEEMIEISKKAEAEFPDDPALQQVHIARKILAKEAELAGLSFVDYIKSLKGEGQEAPR